MRTLTDHSGVSQPAISKHLGVLKRAGLVGYRRAGRETHYSAQPRGLPPIFDWMDLYAAFWHERLDRLDALLSRVDE